MREETGLAWSHRHLDRAWALATAGRRKGDMKAGGEWEGGRMGRKERFGIQPHLLVPKGEMVARITQSMT